MEAAGMAVRVDDFGTMTGCRSGAEPGPAVLLGSHLDSVLHGGRYDGTYGVIAALEVVRTLNDFGIVTRLPIEVVNGSDEEGARFEPANTASGAVAGCFSRDFVYDRVDRDGRRFKDELLRIGYLERKPAARARQSPIWNCMSSRGLCWKMRVWQWGWWRASSG
jgi:N-carbamoyl-L-amino-acid hydrolase